MTAAGNLWRQIHEFAKIVDQHPVEGLAVERLAIELHGLPTAKRQSVQHDLHLLLRWLQLLADQHANERAGPRHSFVKANQRQDRWLPEGQSQVGEAKQLARSLSDLDDDGSPVPEVERD